ncbi:hypothetical protein [Pseudomonas glycinae]|uniref:hypothetical protein n=1 Tax=Pseudomonas glycinae TaxID=1785145 RepID=UPI00167E604E|nr:hypothetical protein [Pseudomonas glycinae]
MLTVSLEEHNHARTFSSKTTQKKGTAAKLVRAASAWHGFEWGDENGMGPIQYALKALFSMVLEKTIPIHHWSDRDAAVDTASSKHKNWGCFKPKNSLV